MSITVNVSLSKLIHDDIVSLLWAKNTIFGNAKTDLVEVLQMYMNSTEDSVGQNGPLLISLSVHFLVSKQILCILFCLVQSSLQN